MRQALAILACAWLATAEARVIHSERSLYRNILVTDTRGERCLRFSVRREQRNQSCIRLEDPDAIVFPYVRMMLASLLLNPEPRRVLVIGLGGGTLPTALRDLYPHARIDVVEIDPAVVRVAQKYFQFRTDAAMQVITADARVYVKRALRRATRYDLVLLDAFGGEYIPEHLMTREFLEEVRDILTDDGVLAANTFSSSRLYDHESATYASVFNQFFNVRSPISRNRIIVASPAGLPDRGLLEARARALQPRMRHLHVDIQDTPARMTTARDWSPDARVLTDQYAPANLLDQ